MADELDLDTGEKTSTDDSKPKRGPGGRFLGRDKPTDGEKRNKGGRPKGGSAARVGGQLEAQMNRVLDRWAEQRESRGDDELAGAIREDGRAITNTVVAALRPFVAIARALTGLLAIVDGLLAFGRVGGILVRRYYERRAQQQPPDDGSNGYGEPVPDFGQQPAPVG